MNKEESKIIKLYCKKGGEIYEEEVEKDEKEIKFTCAIHHCRLYKVKK